MNATEMQQIGEDFLPDHSKDRWRFEGARITNRTERTVRNWEALNKVPENEAKLLIIEHLRLRKSNKRKEKP